MSRIFLVAGLVIALSSLSAIAHEHHGPSSSAGDGAPGVAMMQSLRQDKARSYFTDLPVIAQDGKERRFFSDVLMDKVVLIYLFFTNCENTCPVINQTLANVQDLLGDRLGIDITLISITTDPARDTPAVVREYSNYFEPRAGWLFLTGDPQNMKTIVGRLGHTSSDPTAHTTFLMVGDVAKAKWTKLKPTASEAEIAAMLNLLADERRE
jgi:cytochrome oxidase Cu insertion factor (SCO1/SenC/PrrC family)